MSPSLRLFIAQERVALGRHASAMESAELCVREAMRSQTLDRREQIVATCRAILNSSQRQVVLVTMSVPAQRRAGFSLRIDGRTLTEAEYVLPLALDAGTHVLEVAATGVDPHRESLRGAPGQTLSFTVPERFVAQPEQGSTGQGTGSAQGAGGVTTNSSGVVNTSAGGAGSNGNTAANGQSSTSDGEHGEPELPVAPPVNDGFFARVGAGPFVVGGVGIGLFALSGALAAVAQGELARSGCRVQGAEIVCRTPEQAQAFASNAPGTPDPYTPTTIAQVSAIGGAVLVVGAGIWMGVAASRSVRASSEASPSSSPAARSSQRRTAWINPAFDPRSATVSLSVGGSF